jgi:hypothetical protein
VNGPISSLPQVVEAALKEANAIVTSGAAVVNLGAGQDADTALEVDDYSISVDFPAILEHDMLPRVQAIVQAATLNGQQTAGTMSDRTLIQLLLKALNVDNADALLDEILPEGAEYFDTEGDAANAANAIVTAASGEEATPSSSSPDSSGLNLAPIKEAFPPKPGAVVPPVSPPTPPPPNPNVDDNGLGMDKSGLHKVAPPPPSMRNKGSGASPSPFDPTQVQPQMDSTGGFTSDKNSQRMKGSTPPRGKP